MVSRRGSRSGWNGPFDPRIRLVGLPAFERLRQDRQDLRRLEVADDHEFAVLRAEVVVIERADLVEADLLEPLDLLVDGRHIADVVAGVLRQQALKVVEALAHGVGPALFDAGDFFVLHHLELAARQASARGGSGGGSPGRRGDSARLVSIVNVSVPSPWPPNPRSIRMFIPVPSRATFLSSRSWICWRVRFLVPRIISPDRNPLASLNPLRFSALP